MAQADSNNLVSNITCLSSHKHDDNINDHLLHYLGCIDISDRKSFFEFTNPIWKKEIEHQVTLGRKRDAAERFVQEKIDSWKKECGSELRRIEFLRYTLSRDRTDRHLVQRITESLHAWRNSPTYTANIQTVRDWRDDRGKDYLEPETIEIRKEKYDLERDIFVPVIQFEDGNPKEINDKQVWNKFPNQKVVLSNILNHEESLLSPKRSSPVGSPPTGLSSGGQAGLSSTEPSRTEPSSNRLVRYFHIPSNNMHWAERAIGAYFDEKPPEYHEIHRELNRTKKSRAYMILRDAYWRGQVHGGQQRSPAHARHLKPLCTTISSDPNHAEHFHRNMVLFMPYLHWDTSRKNEQFTGEIEDIMGAARENALARQAYDKRARQNDRQGLYIPETLKRAPGLSTKYHKHEAKILTMKRLLRALKEDKKLKSQLQIDKEGRIEIANPLGQLLLDAARLYEGISNYRDKMLLRNYLTMNPPLHPRRTLDQAYHWTLNSTRDRDRDQVVYRDTTAKSDDFHRYKPPKKPNEPGEWTKHEIFQIKDDCPECRQNIQKLSRVIMVDQLWMWILDAETIITCFPKRYGTNKQDTSAIHKSIRLRIQEGGPDQVRTVFDLGLIIIDECTNTFFDQTRTVEPQPQVMDAFSKAIGNIMHRQSVSFEKLWHWTHDASKVYRSDGNGDKSGLNIPVLDINPEGQLEREIKDIIEELDIIIHIAKIHKKMLIAFISNAENILDPFGRFGKNQQREIRGRHLWNKFSDKPKELEVLKDGKDDDDEVRKKSEDYDWFKLNADERLETIKERIEDLEELRKSAMNTADCVKDLLELKQQQASVVQAWQAVKQSEETIKQGRSIMIFTLVTIVFLPLSFMSSVFGMNNREITDDTWSISTQLLYMFTISAGVIFISLLLAFGSWIRASIFYVWKRFITKSLVISGLYSFWLDVNLPGKRLHTEADRLSNKLKLHAQKTRLDEKFAKRIEKERLEDQSDGGLNTPLPLFQNGYANGRANGFANGHANGHTHTHAQAIGDGASSSTRSRRAGGWRGFFGIKKKHDTGSTV